MGNKLFSVIVIGAGSRGQSYTNIMADLPDMYKVVGVAEPMDIRRNYIKEKHNVPDENCYLDYKQIFAREKFADIAVISTQDRLHLEPALKAIELGYDLLLEKPACPTPEDCRILYNAAKEKGTRIIVCHVLRYTPFFLALKDIIDSGKLGKIMTVEHIEGIGLAHMSHSFVRGNWHNSEESSSMLLQKSCHDLDILQWLVGKECKKISSFGHLTYFKKENQPSGAPDYCVEGCPKTDCPFNSYKLYYEYDNIWFRRAMTKLPHPTKEDVLPFLSTSQYGRCVYKCDNDVVDHQVVNMEFDDDITAVFSMTAFSTAGRRFRICGTHGELIASAHETQAEFHDFISNKTEYFPTNKTVVETSLLGGHGGGDGGIILALYDYLTGKKSKEQVSEIDISVRNHMLVFAAEESRINGTVVDTKEYIKKHLG